MFCSPKEFIEEVASKNGLEYKMNMEVLTELGEDAAKEKCVII